MSHKHILGGKPVVRGARVPVELVLRKLGADTYRRIKLRGWARIRSP